MTLKELKITEFSNLEYFCDCKKKHVLNGEFIYGDYRSILNKAVKKACPFLKAVIVSSEEGFLSFGKKLYEELIKSGNKIFNVLLKESTDEIERAGAVFNLPEDVRAIIVFESGLFNLAAYYASLKNISLIFIPVSVNIPSVFSKYVTVFIGGKKVRYLNASYKYVLIDEKIIDESILYGAYATVISSMLDLVDYRVKSNFISTWSCTESFNLKREAVKTAFGISKIPKPKRAITLLECQLKSSIADGFTSDKIGYGSGVFGVSEILKHSGISEFDAKMLALFKLIDLYAIYWSGAMDDYLLVPDFIKRTKEFVEISKLPEREIINGYKRYDYKRAYIYSRTKKLKSTLKRELAGALKAKSRIFNTYIELGGSEKLFEVKSEIIRSALYFGADFPEGFSTLTLIRQAGALELL